MALDLTTTMSLRAMQGPEVIKGEAGSPYAIKDYYDIDPDIAVDVPNRMTEFTQLVSRTHKAGMKVIIDFVPNHVARQYNSDAKPAGIKDLGADDDQTKFFDINNNFYYIPYQQFSPHIIFCIFIPPELSISTDV